MTLSAYADGHGTNRKDRNDHSDCRRCGQPGSRRRPAGRCRPAGSGRTPGTAPSPERPRPRLVLAGHRQPPGRHQADRASQVRSADREAMMFERFTDGARHLVVQAQNEARRLGHNYIGCEHLLLAATKADGEAGAVLRDQGVTPERVEEQILRMIGRGTGAAGPACAGGPADPLHGLDQEALAAIGIDLDVVRARLEAAFGPDALDRAVVAYRRGAQPGRPGRPGPALGTGPVARLMHVRRTRRARRVAFAGPGPHGASQRLPGPAPRGHI